MAQVTRAVAQGILDGQGYTDNEVRQLAFHWLRCHSNAEPAATPWYPDDSGEWVEVPEDSMEMPVELDPASRILILQKRERDTQRFSWGVERADFWPWDRESNNKYRIVAYKVVKP